MTWRTIGEPETVISPAPVARTTERRVNLDLMRIVDETCYWYVPTRMVHMVNARHECWQMTRDRRE